MNASIHLTDAARVGVVKIERDGGLTHWIDIKDGEGGEIAIFGTPEQFAEIGRKIHETLTQWEGENIQPEIKPQGISQIPPDNIRKLLERNGVGHYFDQKRNLWVVLFDDEEVLCETEEELLKWLDKQRKEA